MADVQLSSEEGEKGSWFPGSVGNLGSACKENEDLQNLRPEEDTLVLQRDLEYENVG